MEAYFQHCSLEEYQVFYDDYVEMWTEMEPCVSLSPLADENYEVIYHHILLIIDKIKDGEDSILSYRQKHLGLL
jgi:hypothetical protein